MSDDTVLVRMPRADFEACDRAFSRPWRIIEESTVPECVERWRCGHSALTSNTARHCLEWLATCDLAALVSTDSVPLAVVLPLLRACSSEESDHKDMRLAYEALPADLRAKVQP